MPVNDFIFAGMETVLRYFSGLTAIQADQFAQLDELYRFWNAQINVISRKDLENLYERHVLHSLAIAGFFTFVPSTRILDVGTGGGFPGIPLAIYFPEVQFMLVDSIGKKIKVVNEVCAALGLKNVTALQARAEDLKEQYDFVVSRAVTALPQFTRWVLPRLLRQNKNAQPNGILYLKGGEIYEEIAATALNFRIYDISELFDSEFFTSKKLIHLWK